MGNAEIALALSVLGPLLVAALAYFAKDSLGNVKAHEQGIASLDKRVAVIEASSLSSTVGEHGTRLTAIEIGLSEIKGDLRYVKRWVESQSDPGRNRRSTDSYGDTPDRGSKK